MTDTPSRLDFLELIISLQREGRNDDALACVKALYQIHRLESEDKGSKGVTISIIPDEVDDVVIQSLKMSYQYNLSPIDNSFDQEGDLLSSIDRVIQYYSTAEDYDAWIEERDAL